MALFSKAGNILRQVSQKHLNQEIAASTPSMFQMIRCNSATTVYVTISKKLDDASLKQDFSSYGDIAEVKVFHRRSKDFGFVTYKSAEAATAAIEAMDGQILHGKRVRVNYVTEKPKPSTNNGGQLLGGGQGGTVLRRIICGGGYGGNKYAWNTYGTHGTRYNNSLTDDGYIGYRLGQCVILHFPKITSVHHFVLPQPPQKRFGANKAPGRGAKR